MNQNLQPPVAVADAAGSDTGGLDAGDASPVDEATTPEEAPVPAPRAALDRDLPDDLDLVVLAARADDGMDTAADSLDLVLDLATAYRRAGQVDAALDACYRALFHDPDAVSLHLAMVELYDDRGWSALAAEKLDLLERLADLDADLDAGGLVAAARTRRG